MRLNQRIIYPVLVFLVLGCGPTSETEHEHVQNSGAALANEHHHQHDEPETSHITTPHDAWQQMLKSARTIEESVQRAELEQVHPQAETITAIAALLRKLSTESDKPGAMLGKLHQISRTSDALHHAADDNNLEEAKLHLEKLLSILQQLENQLPTTVRQATQEEPAGAQTN